MNVVISFNSSPETLSDSCHWGMMSIKMPYNYHESEKYESDKIYQFDLCRVLRLLHALRGGSVCMHAIEK